MILERKSTIAAPQNTVQTGLNFNKTLKGGTLTDKEAIDASDELRETGS
jgi:hypothetical protein